MNEWTKLGGVFEEIYYRGNADIAKKIEDYKKLQMKINELKYTESPEKQNFVTDVIHVVSLKTCLKDNDKYINPRKEEIREMKEEKKKQKAEQKEVTVKHDKELVEIKTIV